MKHILIVFLIATSLCVQGQPTLDNFFLRFDYRDNIESLLEAIRNDRRFKTTGNDHELGTNGSDYFIGEVNLDSHFGLDRESVLHFLFSIKEITCNNTSYNVMSISVVGTNNRKFASAYKSLRKDLDTRFTLLNKTNSRDTHLNDLTQETREYSIDDNFNLKLFCITNFGQGSINFGLTIVPSCY